MPPSIERHSAVRQSANSSGAKGDLTYALDAARELLRQLASIPEEAPEARHPSYGVLRGLVHTMVDMLEEIAVESEATGVPGSGQRAKKVG